ncbi:MAG: RNA 2'-phosphotransferase [Armatimonadetes bacterium]|nr:RNA 2'-phosphotransferase [Armatimonadota bacterium]
MSPEERKRLSKFLTLVLRHEPEKLGLKLDAQGFVGLSELIEAIWRNPRGRPVTEEQILEVVETSDKQRFEIVGNKIRARYGHSIGDAVIHEEVEPPEILYHGTSPAPLPAIREKGLLPMKRQYVHLSTEVDTALQVGRRHHPRPIILTVRAHEAWQAGARFYQPKTRLFLSDALPTRFITFEEENCHDSR